MAWRLGQSYSADLRGRVLTAVDEGSAIAAVAELFRVGVSYIYKALARRRQTGETEARPQRSHQAPKLAAHHEAIRAEVARRPDVTLDELRAWLKAEHGVSASLGLMHNTLARLDLTRKKRLAGRKSRIGRMSPSPALSGVPGREISAGDCSSSTRPGRIPRWRADTAGARAAGAWTVLSHTATGRRRPSSPASAAAASSLPTCSTGR